MNWIRFWLAENNNTNRIYQVLWSVSGCRMHEYKFSTIKRVYSERREKGLCQYLEYFRYSPLLNRVSSSFPYHFFNFSSLQTFWLIVCRFNHLTMAINLLKFMKNMCRGLARVVLIWTPKTRQRVSGPPWDLEWVQGETLVGSGGEAPGYKGVLGDLTGIFTHLQKLNYYFTQ